MGKYFGTDGFRGEANVTIQTMIILANALDVEMVELFDFKF